MAAPTAGIILEDPRSAIRLSYLPPLIILIFFDLDLISILKTMPV